MQINKPIPPDAQLGNEIPVIFLKNHKSKTAIQPYIIGTNKILRIF